MKSHLLGLFLLALGLFLAFEYLYSPMRAADNHETKVSVSMKGAVLAPLLIVMGAVYAVMGPRAEDYLGTRHERRPLSYIIGVVLVVVGFALYFWMKGNLEARGYQFK